MSESGTKPKYEKPCLMDFNDRPEPVDAACSRGTLVTGHTCRAGAYAGACGTGTRASANDCSKGGTATSWCYNGATPRAGRCVAGGRP